MKRKCIKREVVDEREGRFIETTFDNGEVERTEVVKQLRKKRYPPRPYWHWRFDRTSKKGL
jgi:hypothetical protein